jgi:hypothetical protein
VNVCVGAEESKEKRSIRNVAHAGSRLQSAITMTAFGDDSKSCCVYGPGKGTLRYTEMDQFRDSLIM